MIRHRTHLILVGLVLVSIAGTGAAAAAPSQDRVFLLELRFHEGGEIDVLRLEVVNGTVKGGTIDGAYSIVMRGMDGSVIFEEPFHVSFEPLRFRYGYGTGTGPVEDDLGGEADGDNQSTAVRFFRLPYSPAVEAIAVTHQGTTQLSINLTKRFCGDDGACPSYCTAVRSRAQMDPQCSVPEQGNPLTFVIVFMTVVGLGLGTYLLYRRRTDGG